MKNRIRRLLLQAGVDPALSGYDYLMTGIQLCYKDRTLLQYITKGLYCTIANAYDVKNANVERCIRNAIDTMKKTDFNWFKKENIGFIENINALTNTQFIAVCVEILKMQEEEDAE